MASPTAPASVFRSSRLRRAASALLLLLLAALLCVPAALPAHADGGKKKEKGLRSPSPLRALSAPKVLKQFDLRDFGSHVVKFGRLTGRDEISALFVQTNYERQITCLTAMSLETGEVLWQLGTPSRNNFKASSEIPVQVYDWNRDGTDDVIFAQAGQIVVSNGANGETIASTAAERPYSLFVFQTSQFGGPAGLVLHGRTSTTLLGPDLSLVWSKPNEFSHFPMALDIDDDEEPELLAGYLLFRSNGEMIWDHRDFGAHNDASDFGDIDCDGQRDLAIATSGKSAAVKTDGTVLWRGVENHSQHITIGAFQAGRCEKQVATIDRDPALSGILRMYSHKGKILWERGALGPKAMMTRIDDWIPQVKESLILVFRGLSQPPTLYDGNGAVVGRLPFPPAIARGNGGRFYLKHYLQHFDLSDDGQEEILLYNERALWVYGNTAAVVGTSGDKPSQALPNPRIFNATFYMGMQ